MRKEIISLILALAMVLSIIPIGMISVSAETVYYNVTGGQLKFDTATGTITGFTGQPTNVVIPEEIDGVTVVAIRYNAFYNCSSLTSITIPNSVSSIGFYGFYNCIALTSISLPNAITEIQENTFQGCSSLVMITIPIGVTSIGNSVFANCKKLKEISLPISLQSIGYSAFNGCTNLVSISIPEGVTIIKDWAFQGCTNLFLISFPSTLTNIGYLAFEDTTWYVLKPDDNVVYAGKVAYGYKGNYNSVSAITLRADTKGIASRAFLGCSDLTEIIIPNSITYIGANAFDGCRNLKNINLPSSIEIIERETFMDCNSLESFIIPSDVTFIGYGAFYNCNSLKNINIPNGVTAINDYTFANCTGLISIDMPSSLTMIGIAVFYNCSGLTSINIPDSVIEVREGAFKNCSGLENINIPNKLDVIYGSTFMGCSSLTNINIPNNITRIANSAFSGCTSITTITIPSSVISIEYQAFENCTSLTKIIIPKSVTKINENVFYKYSGLTIYGEKGSYAETYAKNNYIPFKQISNGGNSLIIIPSTSLTLNTTQHTFNGIGKELSIVATLSPANTSNQSLKITSSNPNVAISKGSVFIADKQVITIVSKGFGNCTIKVENEGNVATCNITVNKSNLTDDEKILRKMALSNIVYHDEVLNSIGKKVKDLNIRNSQNMMYVNGQAVDWNEFWDKYIGDYEIIGASSTGDGVWGNDMQAVAFKDDNGDIVISYRGSSSFRDIYEGIRYTIANSTSKQFKAAYNFYKFYYDAYSPYGKNISLTGHSLGGALASYVSILDGSVKADVFNDATGWILWNTYVDNTFNIKKFDGVNVARHTSYVNVQFDLKNDYVVYKLFLNYRNNYEMKTNGYDVNEGDIHGMPAMITYSSTSKEFGLSKNMLNGVWTMNIAKAPWEWSEMWKIELLHLGTDGDDTIYAMRDVINQNYVYTGNGNDKVTASTNNDFIIAIGEGKKELVGRSGNDTYVVDKNINNDDIYIRDCGGKDTLVIKNVSDTENFNIIDNGSNYYLTLNNNCKIYVNKNRDVLDGPLTVELRDSNGTLLRTMKFEPSKMLSIMSAKYMLSNSQYTLKSIKLMGDVEVSVFDENNNLLGTHNNLQSEIITTPYGYFYPSFENGENAMLIDLINGNYTLKITSNSFVGCEVYDPQAQGSVWYGKKGIDLSDGSKLVVNTDFINTQNKFAIERNGLVEPLTARERVYASSVNINQSSINIKAGEKQVVSATVLPNNSLGFEVSWEVIQPDENSTVATVIKDGGITNVIGITEGVAILRATAMDDGKAFAEIPITVTQSAPPKIYSDNYIEGSYTDAESVRVYATAPLGFDKLFINGNEQSYVDITEEGQNKVYAYAMNSETGEVTKTAIYNVNIDRKSPMISGVENGAKYYFDRFISAYDVNLASVTVNNIEWTTEELKGEKIFSEVGNYTVAAQDFSGKTTTVSFEILPMPNVSDISSDSVKLINSIRDEFEQVKYDLPQNKVETLENQISAIESQWITQTGIWSISLEKVNDTTINAKIINRLNEYSNPPILLLSFYKENKLLFVKRKTIESDVTDYTFEIQASSGANSVKALLWKSIDSLEPACNSAEIVIN